MIAGLLFAESFVSAPLGAAGTVAAVIERTETLPVPIGRRLDLPDRGKTFVREVGDPDAPYRVLLVHGWLASAGLNWATTFDPLGEQFHVLAPDLRGHGRGPRSMGRFRLEDCADDLAALLAHLGPKPTIVVGYSMGGLVAQLLWRHRPDLVSGLVLCSTTQAFVLGRRKRYVVAATMYYAANTVRLSRLMTRWYRPPTKALVRFGRGRPKSMRAWATAEMRRHDLRQVFEAGYATCRFDSKPWLGSVDVPAAVIVTTKDRAIPPDAQFQLAASIEGSRVFTLDDDHAACSHAEFASMLVDACRDVATRIEAPS
jgi:pimeloyl-ACP methyl ester carboxylesterase